MLLRPPRPQSTVRAGRVVMERMPRRMVRRATAPQWRRARSGLGGAPDEEKDPDEPTADAAQAAEILLQARAKRRNEGGDDAGAAGSREIQKGKGKGSFNTCKTLRDGTKICKMVSDARGCDKGSACPDAHCCDIMLPKNSQACGSKTHFRFRTYGA